MARVYCTVSLVEALGHTGWVSQNHWADLSPFLLKRAHDFNGSQAARAKTANVNGPRGTSTTHLLQIGADPVRRVGDHLLLAIRFGRVGGVEGTVGPERICEGRG